MNIVRVGLDLAKNVFSVCGIDEHEHIALERVLKRAELLVFFANLPPCVVGMEAGSGAHHWARELIKLCHTPKIIDPKFVSPYRTRGTAGKNDRNDARAICEAMARPQARFVPVKTQEQQAVLTLHRIRAGYVSEHTRVINQLRGLLAEYGLVFAKGPRSFHHQWRQRRPTLNDVVPELALLEFDQLYQRICAVTETIHDYDRRITRLARSDEAARHLMQRDGIGPITASAIIATIGDGHDFKNGRQLAAWLGLTPRQSSSGGKTRLGRISKQGDCYIRTLLVHGARTVLQYTPKRNDPLSRWAENLKQRKSWNKVAVAVANKQARAIWALLQEHKSHPA
jgi:transposase